jgi:hypothetical protein
MKERGDAFTAFNVIPAQAAIQKLKKLAPQNKTVPGGDDSGRIVTFYDAIKLEHFCKNNVRSFPIKKDYIFQTSPLFCGLKYTKIPF